MSYVLLLGFFFTEYVRPTSYVPALLALHLNSIVPLGALVASLVGSGQAVMERMLKETNTKIIGTFLAAVWVSALTADVQERSALAWEIVLGFSFIYWVIASEANTVPRVKGIVQALIVVHLIVAALNPVLFTDPGTRHYVSSGAFLGDGNDLALSLNIILPLCLFLMLDAKRSVGRFVWMLALFVCVAGVVVSQSRGGTVGLACMGLYYWTKSRKKFQTALVVAAVVGMILALAPGSYFERMNMIGDTQEGSAQARITAWKIAVRMALDNPLLGVGAAHFGIKFGNEYRPAGYEGSGMTAHSIYFLALGELGFPGFFMLIAFIVHNLLANRRLAREVRQRGSPTADTDLQMLASLSAAVVAFSTTGAFLSALYYPHIFVLAGLLTGTRAVVRERLQNATGVVGQPEAAPGPAYHWALARPVPAWNTRPEDQRPSTAPAVSLAAPRLRPRTR